MEKRHGGSGQRADRLEKANDEVYDFGKAAGFEEDAKDGGGARFLSVDVDLEVENDSNEVGEAHLIVARLAQKAVLAAEARKPILKKREIKPRFGGARGVLADNEAGRGQGGLDTIEAEFLRELEDNVPQTFLPPQNADDDENEVEDDLSKPFFFTQDVWEDIEYNQRKQSIIEQLSTASDRVAQAQVMLPQLKVENERLKNTARQLEQEVQKLADQERKIFQKYPDLKKKYQKDIKNDDDIIDPKEASDTQQESVNADEAKEQKRHLEKLRRRMLKRKNLVVKGLQNLEENERDKGESFAQDKNTYSVLNLLYTRAVQLKISIEKNFSAFDPYRPSLETIKKKMPRAVVYFQMLRRTNYVNSIFIIASVPQVIQWILGDALCSEDTLIMPCIFRFSSIQRYLGGDTGEGAGRLGVDMSLLYVYVNASAYLLVYFVTMRHYFTDFYVAIRAGIFQEDQNQYKISQIVLNSWNCSVFTRAAHGAIAERVCSQLALMFAIRKEEGIPREEELDNGESTRLQVFRIAGGFLIGCVCIGAWIVLEVFSPDDLDYYPKGWQRIVAPAVAAAVNKWIFPTILRLYVKQSRFPKTEHARILIVALFLSRLVNVVVIIRRQYLVVSAPSRVMKSQEAPDTCFCEDEVGTNFFLFWVCDWAATVVKVVVVPLVYIQWYKLQQTDRIRDRIAKRWVSVWRPRFEISVWMIDVTFCQLLFFCTIPMLPSAPFICAGCGIVNYAVQHVFVINLWQPPKSIVYDPNLVRLFFSVTQIISLHGATLVYFYFWVYGATNLWDSPICKLPVMYQNATSGLLCSFDPTTGKSVTAQACPPYAAQACQGYTSRVQPFIPLYAHETPARIVSTRTRPVVAVLGQPVFAWVLAALLFLRLVVQRNYRHRFQEYVEEQRFRLLLKLTMLDRTLKKQDKLLDIQRAL